MSSTAHDKRFDPALAHRLEDPERLKWLPPDDVLRHLLLEPHMTVVDIGAGTGYFALPLAQAVDKVFAVDVQPEMLSLLREKLTAQDAPRNIELVEGESAVTHLPPHSCDRALLANLWHELEEPRDTLCEMGRILKPGGRVAILDWRPDTEHPPGPPLEVRVPLERVMETLHRSGWVARAGLRIGLHHYLVLAERS